MKKRDYVYISDVVNAFILACRKKIKQSISINICSGKSINNLKIVKTILSQMGLKKKLTNLNKKVKLIIIQKMFWQKKILNWEPKVSFKDGIEMCIDFLLKKTSFMDKCIVCGNKNLNKFLDLGKTALANNFLEPEDLNLIVEEFYPLRVAYCNNCFHVQLIDHVNPKKMFDNYLYISSASKTLTDHLYSLAKVITRKIPFKRNDLVIDIGSNDGTLLSSFKKIDKKLEVLGVEPAKESSKICK